MSLCLDNMGLDNVFVCTLRQFHRYAPHELTASLYLCGHGKGITTELTNLADPVLVFLFLLGPALVQEHVCLPSS